MFTSLSKEIYSIWEEIKGNRFSYFFLFFQLVYFSGLVRQFGTDESLLANLVITAAICLFQKKIKKNDEIYFLEILSVFVLINIIPSILFGFEMKLLLGYSGRIFLGFLILVYYRNNFYIIFEKIVFFLAFISLPLFLIQVFHVQIYDIFQGVSELFLSDERLLFGRYELSGHRYFFIFLVNSWGKYRNSGFMWEPAAFGAVLAWAMLINVFIHRFRLNPRLFVLFISALTTFSIGTYIYLSIFAFIYLTKNFGNRHGLLFLLLILVILPAFLRFQFVQENLEMITGKIQKEQSMAEKIRSKGYAHDRVSRVGGFIGNIGILVEEPFGLGTQSEIQSYNLYKTPNGLMVLLRNWGVFSIILLTLCAYITIWKLSRIYNYRLNIFHVILMMMIILLPIGGNPFYNQPFLFSILLSGFVLTKKQKPGLKPLKNSFYQSKGPTYV